MTKFKGTITVTFSEVVENQKGMEEIGEKAKTGFSIRDLRRTKRRFKKIGVYSELVYLRSLLPEELREQAEEAAILVVHNPLKKMGQINKDQILDELVRLKWDKKAFMKGRVVNKKARYNLCFADFSQEPDYENKKGRVVDFADLSGLSSVRDQLSTYFGKKARELKAEGNNYYDPSTCSIGYHGDVERKRIIALRLGKPMSLYYRWYLKGEKVGDLLHLELKHGDMYMMSTKAGGSDWLKRNTLTLRHAAGKVQV